MYILDRFEENFAVIEHTDKYGEISIIKTAKDTVSPEVKEGDVLCLEDGIYITDEKATNERRNRINNKLSNIDKNGKRKKGELLKDLNIYVIINCIYLIVSAIGIYFEGYSGIFGGLLFNYVFFGACILNVLLDIVLLIYSIYNIKKRNGSKIHIFTVIITVFSLLLNICGNWIAYNLILCPA